MTQLTDTKEIILALKKVKEEKNLSLDKIIALMEEQDNTAVVSKSTLSRVFSEGSENESTNFRFETTLKPICNALLNIESDEENDTVDVLAYKNLLRYKHELLTDYERQNKQLKDEIETIKNKERSKYAEKLEKETKHFNDSLSFMSKQIQLKDQRIDTLLDSNAKLLDDNHKLLLQLLKCPYHKEEM